MVTIFTGNRGLVLAISTGLGTSGVMTAQKQIFTGFKLSVDMRFAGVCIFLAKFFLALLDPVPCTQVCSPSKKIECFVENFLAEENIARFVIMN